MWVSRCLSVEQWRKPEESGDRKGRPYAGVSGSDRVQHGRETRPLRIFSLVRRGGVSPPVCRGFIFRPRWKQEDTGEAKNPSCQIECT